MIDILGLKLDNLLVLRMMYQGSRPARCVKGSGPLRLADELASRVCLHVHSRHLALSFPSPNLLELQLKLLI